MESNRSCAILLSVFLGSGWLAFSEKCSAWQPIGHERLRNLFVGSDPPPNQKCCQRPSSGPCCVYCYELIACVSGATSKGFCYRTDLFTCPNDSAACIDGGQNDYCSTPVRSLVVEVRKCTYNGLDEACVVPWGPSNYRQCQKTYVDPPGSGETVTINACNNNEALCSGGTAPFCN